jgi:hypothetical protein
MDDEPDRDLEVSAGSPSSKGPGSHVTRRPAWRTSGPTPETGRQGLEAYRNSIESEVTGVKPSALNWMV